MTIGGENMVFDNIEAERARKKMTIEQLAKILGINRRTYYAWVNKGDIPANKLIKMCHLFNCSVDYLLGLTLERK